MQEFTFSIYALYFQLYLQDEAAVSVYEEIEWTTDQVHTLNYTSTHSLVLATVREGTVPVSVQLYEARPVLDPARYNHVVECSLTIVSGAAALLGLNDEPGTYQRIPMANGVYGIWLCYENLDSVDELGLEGADRYTIVAWPESRLLEKRVLKQVSP